MKVKWKRSQDGFCESADGKWHITPLYCGRTRPEFFELWYYPETMSCKKLPLPRVRVLMLEANQKACKDHVAGLDAYPEVK